MPGNTTINGQLLIRQELWSNQLKETLKDTLEAQKYVDWIDFPDGNTLTIPSIGDADHYDYTEDSAIEYTPLATGEFQFQITEYVASATYITAKMRQDSFYAARLEAAFVPEQRRAIEVRLEGDILRQGQPGTPNGQTAGNANKINSADHRWVAMDTANSVPALGAKDFAKARYALTKANVPLTNLVAIVDPSTEYYLNTQAELLDVSYNPKWEGIITSGFSDTTGMRFTRNIFGFDVYVSNYLPTLSANETIGGATAPTGSVANLFFSMSPNVRPFIGAWRQYPKVDAEWNKDRQREEYVTTARYGLKIYRPENFVTVLSSPNVIV